MLEKQQEELAKEKGKMSKEELAIINSNEYEAALKMTCQEAL